MADLCADCKQQGRLVAATRWMGAKGLCEDHHRQRLGQPKPIAPIGRDHPKTWGKGPQSCGGTEKTLVEEKNAMPKN